MKTNSSNDFTTAITLKHILTYVLFSLVVIHKIAAQAPSVEWVKQIKSTANEVPNAMAFDDSGNVYTTGYYSGYTDFDPGPAIYTLSPGGSRDVFISKLDSSGNFVWAIPIKGSGQIGQANAEAIKIDNAGNIYITGIIDYTFDFDPSPATFYLTASNGFSDVFVAKYDASGSFIWAKKFAEYAMKNEKARDMVLDNAGNIYIAGVFKSTVDFDPSVNTFNLTATGATEDAFLCKLDSGGNFKWAKRLGGNDYTDVVAIAIDSTANIYMAGHFAGTTDFNGDTALTFNLTSAGVNYEDFFACRYDSAGNYNWVKKIGVANSQLIADDIAIDCDGNINAAGTFFDTVDFDPGLGVANLTASVSSDHEMFILKWDSLGNYIWAKKLGNDQNSRISSIALDDSANVYATGYFMSTIDVDPGPLVYNITSYASNLYRDAFVYKLSTAGNLIWATTFGGAISDFANVIAFGPDNKPVIGGTFASMPAYFGSYSLNNTATATTDMFICKLGFINTGIKNSTNDASFSIYPNPTADKITINISPDLLSKHLLIELVNVVGEKMLATTLINSNNSISLMDLKPGIYFYKIFYENEACAKGKIVKQ